MIIILLSFLLFLLCGYPSNSLAKPLILLYTLSLSSNFLIGSEILINRVSEIFYTLWTAFVIFLLISPWKNYKPILKITCTEDRSLKLFVYIVGGICIIMTVGCSIIAYIVSQVVENIDVFKYKGGQQEVYANLGLSMKPYLLAYILYPISYLFIPLIFYYLSIKKIRLTIWCFLSSLTPVAYGFAYFSRANTIHYIFLLFIIYFYVRNSLPLKFQKNVQKVGLILCSIFLISFITISNSRFDGKYYEGKKNNAIIQNTVLYSMADYFGQWWYAGSDVFEDYNLTGFNGQIAFQGINRSLNLLSFGRISSYSEELFHKREILLKKYAGSFIGVSCYFLYDTGFLISTIILILYFVSIKKITPLRKEVSIDKLFMITIMIQLPLFGIFYSTLDTIILLWIYYFLIKKGIGYISKKRLRIQTHQLTKDNVK